MKIACGDSAYKYFHFGRRLFLTNINISSPRYERVYLLLYKVADTPFLIQGGDILSFNFFTAGTE